jgi:uncharacterized membrane protein YccC
LNRDINQTPATTQISSRTASGISWSLCALTLTLVVCAVVLAFLKHYHEYPTYLVSTAVAALVGGLIASHRPTNPVSWFIAGYALCFALGEFTRQYAIYGFLTEPGALPFASAVAWPTYWVWGPASS